MPSVIASTVSEPRIRAAIAHAAQSSGVDFGYLYNQARIESGLNPNAKARTSSAAGLFQFTKQTWLQTVEAHGAAYGAGWAADAIVPSKGRLTVADPGMRTAIAALRYDPDFASAMAGEFAADNRARLEITLGRPAEPVDLYLAHFLGSGGASRFLAAHDADPDAPAAPMFRAAAAANRAIFFGVDGAPRSLAQIRANFAAKIAGAPPTVLAEPVASALWQTGRSNLTPGARAPMEMADFDPQPPRLSLEFAARAYRRLAGMDA